MKHKIFNYSIEHPDLLVNFKRELPQKADFAYTDPPWGNGNLGYWKTIAKRQTGKEHHQIKQPEMEDCLVNILDQTVKHYAFIVYGVKETPSLVEKLTNTARVSNVQVVTKEYRSGSKWYKNTMICVTYDNNEIIDWSHLEGFKGMKTLYAVIRFAEAENYKTVLEPFVGIGHYLKQLHRDGFTVIGNEYNSARRDKALAKCT